MGLLDWVKTPEGQALAATVAGYAANARRGTPVNNIGRGLGAGIGAYGNALASQQNAEEEKFNQQYRMSQMQYLTDKIANDRMRLDQQRKNRENEAKGDAQAFQNVFGIPVDINQAGDDYELIPAGYYSDMIQVAEKKPAPEFNINPQVGKMYGFTPEDLNYIQGVYQMDPKEALREMRELRKAYRKGGTEARDAIAKERAIAEAMGLPVGDYLKQKFNKQSGVNVNVQNIMPGEAAEKAGQKEGYEIGEQAAMIENKYSAVDSVREAREMLKQGIYSGYWGDMGKTIAKASLGAIGDRQKAARTEEFMSYIGNTVVPRLKEFGGNDSNEEMRYLQKIMGGDTSMEPEAIANILESAERKIQRGIERLQRQRGALEQGRMPDLGPGPSRSGMKQPTKPALAPQSNPAQQGGWSIKRKD